MRLDKLLSTIGYGSRKEVKGLLKTGAVKVDGTAVKDAKVHVNPDEQEITVHGEAVLTENLFTLCFISRKASYQQQKILFMKQFWTYLNLTMLCMTHFR